MKGFLILGIIVLSTFTTAFGAGAPLPVSLWVEDVGGVAANSPDVPTGRQFTTVRIDTLVSYIRYLFQHKQALILPDNGQNWFFYAYNDNESHIRTKIFTEDQLLDEASWIVQDIFEWTETALRYVCPHAYNDAGIWYPQATHNSHGPPDITRYQIDEGAVGAGIWSNPYDVTGPQYDYYLPLCESGPDNVVYMAGMAREFAQDRHVFKAFDGWTGDIVDPPGEVMIFPEGEAYSQGYENSQLLYRDGTIIIAIGGVQRPGLQ